VEKAGTHTICEHVTWIDVTHVPAPDPKGKPSLRIRFIDLFGRLSDTSTLVVEKRGDEGRKLNVSVRRDSHFLAHITLDAVDEVELGTLVFKYEVEPKPTRLHLPVTFTVPRPK
jgi:hypothetical protein